MRVRKQVLASPGAVGVSLIAQPMRKRFWTLSAWTDEDRAQQIRANVPAHRRDGEVSRLARGTGFATWTIVPGELPKKLSNAKELWTDARLRLADTKEGQPTR